ncbi:DMT family transporter [uncultured Clostridium sp.]|uniref:DMT family transporter n=1 Tax=uncultured Clostridium sp. TaxID=59620 RepID=UPI0025E0953E|nr:DMT family transporter [uncultured Clostridium sp.]
MNKSNIKGNVILMITALIWGTAFVAQSVGMDYVGPFTFITARYIVGGLFLIPCIYLLDRINKKPVRESGKDDKKTLLTGGFLCGTALFTASCFQQIGIQYTTVGKSGFITALYIIIVPLLGILFKKRVSVKVWISVVISLIGLYLLCMNESFSISRGDFLILMCAFCFSIHILIIDKYSSLVDSVRMSCIQFFVAGLLGVIPMFIFENPQIKDMLNACSPILYAGIMSSGVAYTLQIIGQKYTSPVLATLIMSIESVFAALSGWIILGEVLSLKEYIGCCLVFSAIILAQLPDRKKIYSKK